MRLQNPFAALAPVGLDSQVLTVLSRSRDHLTADQIHRVLPEHGSLSGVRKSLDRLLRQGIVSERAAGHISGYALNQDHLLINAVLMVADAKSALTTRIRETVQQQFSFEPTLVLMFGSAARGDMSDDSDIDLLFVIPDGVPEEQAEDQLSDLAHSVLTWTGNTVGLLTYREGEVASAPIFDSVMREGIEILGDMAWLRRASRRAKAAS